MSKKKVYYDPYKTIEELFGATIGKDNKKYPRRDDGSFSGEELGRALRAVVMVMKAGGYKNVNQEKEITSKFVGKTKITIDRLNLMKINSDGTEPLISLYQYLQYVEDLYNPGVFLKYKKKIHSSTKQQAIKGTVREMFMYFHNDYLVPKPPVVKPVSLTKLLECYASPFKNKNDLSAAVFMEMEKYNIIDREKRINTMGVMKGTKQMLFHDTPEMEVLLSKYVDDIRNYVKVYNVNNLEEYKKLIGGIL